MRKVYLANIPDLIEIQKSSFCWFLEEGLSDELKQLSTLGDFMETVEIRFFHNEFYFHQPFRIPYESRRNKLSYSIKLYIPIEV